MDKKKKSDRNRAATGRMISLAPLTYEEAVSGLLAVKPPPKKAPRKKATTKAKTK